MKIKKTFQGTVPENKILNEESYSQTDTYSCNYVNSTTSKGGTESITTFDDVGVGGKLQRSGFYTVCINETDWYNLLNIRHRNGDGDGPYYGLQIRNNMLPSYDKLQVRQQSSSWQGWRTLQEEGITLYENSSGSNGTIALNESVVNFKKVEVHFFLRSSGINYYNSVEIDNPNAKPTSLEATKPVNGHTIFGLARVVFSNEYILMEANVTYLSNNMGTPAATDEVHIYKVVGYR